MLTKRQNIAKTQFYNDLHKPDSRARRALYVANHVTPNKSLVDDRRFMALALQIYYVWINAGRGISWYLSAMAAHCKAYKMSWEDAVAARTNDLRKHTDAMRDATIAKWLED
jgi:hypothetical protein